MKKLLYFLCLATLLLTACDDDDDDTSIVDGTSTELSGDVTSDVTLDASVTYTLTGTMAVKDGATLTIPAGTTIKATGGFSSYIVIEQGGKIDAEGTADNPIIMTSGEDSPAAGDWGGLIINGYAPISGATTGTTGTTEIDTDLPYGGTDAEDNSGTITYLELAYTGARSSSDVEHNGLTLDAVGSGTTINNLYIIEGADDGVEFFGGTVNVSNLLVVNQDDDAFDCTQGWSGTLDNAYDIWEDGYTSSESDPRGIEADGNLDGDTPSDVDQSDFTMKNITIVNNSEQQMDDIVKIRRGATATISNVFAKNGSTSSAVNVYDSKGSADAATTINITLSNVTYETQTTNTDDVAADITYSVTNSGADISVWDWTGYDFPTEELSGDVSSTKTLDASTIYTLTGTLAVKDGGTLTIPAGTSIFATGGFSSYVVIEQGGKIDAEGTAADPIIMTSGETEQASADWGGLIINGYAPISGATTGTTGTTEIDTSLPYGGTDAEDNSGTVTYLVLAYTGARSSSDVEHNGLTLDAVGSGTTIDNIYVPEGADDGVEFFGGTVSVSNLLVVNQDDDAFDCTQGWSGTLDNAYDVWEDGYTSSESDPRGIEADGNLDGNTPDDVGQSDFVMKNITIVNNSEQEMDDIIKIRRGATATISNVYAMNGSTGTVVNMADSKGLANDNSNVSITINNVSYDTEIQLTATIDEVEETSAATVSVTEGTAEGATTSVWAWTGYSF